MSELTKDVIDTLKTPSADRQIPVIQYDLCDEPVTLYVFTRAEAYELKMWDKVLWTFRRRFEWEDANPVRAWSWRWLGVFGPAKKFGSDYPGA